MAKKKASFRMRNWDTEFIKSLNNGTGFIIDTSIDYSEYLNSSDISVIKQVFELDGIYSYKFGMSSQVENNSPLLKKLYTCKCHTTYGLENVENVCPKCGTIVRRSIPYRMGWIDLLDNKILHPFLCELLFTKYRKVTTDKVTGEVNVKQTNDDKAKSKPEKDSILIADLLKSGKIKYTWKDILFGGKLEEFLKEYFYNSKNIWSLIKLLNGNYFVSKIEVLSAEYRPIKIQEIVKLPEIKQHPYNVRYMNISDTVRTLLTDKSGILQLKTTLLVNIMRDIAQIAKYTKDELGGSKKATLRGDNYSRRMKNSARLVIEPIEDYDIYDTDAVGLPIDVFRSIFRSDILKLLNKYDLDGSQRQKLIDHDQVLTKEERKFIKDEIFPQIKHPYVYVNREPCIYITSALGMRVYLTEDRDTDFGREMVMRIPFFVLPAIAGDFKLHHWSPKSALTA